MADEASSWQQANEYFLVFYRLVFDYRLAMASNPPQVEIAYRILNQMYDHSSIVLHHKTRASLEKQLESIRSDLYDEEYSKYSFAITIQRQRKQRRQGAISKLGKAQRDLFRALHEKKFLIPWDKPRASGYGLIGPGGISE